MKDNYEKATIELDENRENLKNDCQDVIKEQKETKYKPEPGTQDYRHFIKTGKCPHCLTKTVKITDKQEYQCSKCKRQWVFRNGNPVLKVNPA